MGRAVRLVVLFSLVTAGWSVAPSPSVFSMASPGEQGPTQDDVDPPPPTDSRSSGRDREDASNEPQTHLIYFVPADRPDEGIDARMPAAVDSIRDWFFKQMSRRPRFDRIRGAVAYDITFVRGELAAAQYYSLGDISDELKPQSFNSAYKRYLVYAAVDRDNICGEATDPVSRQLESDSPYAAVYLDSSPACGARALGGGTAATSGKGDTIAAHEWLHAHGIVPIGAPRHCSSSPYHVCTGTQWITPELDPEAIDLMFPLITDRLAVKVLDRNRDDYLDHGLLVFPDLRDSVWLE